MSTDNTQDGAEPSLASDGSHNTHMAMVRMWAANTWLQEEIKRLRLTDAEREAVRFFSKIDGPHNVPVANKRAATLRSLLERLK
jgi:hypothetical protein